MPARAPVVVAAEQALVERLRERGHPFVRVAERKTFINRDLDEMTVQLAVNAGPPATFGPLTFKGREAVEESYLRRLAEWPQGGAYDQRDRKSVVTGKSVAERVELGGRRIMKKKKEEQNRTNQ